MVIFNFQLQGYRFSFAGPIYNSTAEVQYLSCNHFNVETKKRDDIMLESYLLHRDVNKCYEWATFGFEICLKARCFCQIFDNTLLVVIGRLAAEEAGWAHDNI